jgi:murein DD-endopeptidase MepM/ murein hydrolase activator NlpD
MVQAQQIASERGLGREHQLGKHWGQDFSASCGTRVHSADAGVVREVGWHQWGGGNRVEVDHARAGRRRCQFDDFTPGVALMLCRGAAIGPTIGNPSVCWPFG